MCLLGQKFVNFFVGFLKSLIYQKNIPRLTDLQYNLNKTKKLTITTHSGSNTFLEPTILASISVYSQNVALLIFGAGPILNFLLNRPTEKSLKKTRKKHMNK